MIIFIARFISLAIGSCNLYLLLFTSKSAANSILELLINAIITTAFITYGLGGNRLLAKIDALKVFSMPINKEHFKNLGNSISKDKTSS